MNKLTKELLKYINFNRNFIFDYKNKNSFI